MRYKRPLLITVLIVATITVFIPGAVAADDVPRPDVGFDTVSEETTDAQTNLEKTEIGFNNTNSSILVRQTLGSNWDKSKQTVLYMDTDRDNSTGITRDFVTDGTAREEYYSNLSFIGADYFAVAGGSTGNATYEVENGAIQKVGDIKVNVSSGTNQVEMAVDNDDLVNSTQFDLKVAYITDPDDLADVNNYDFHPDPSGDENRSITFDTGEGIIGTSVGFTVGNTSAGSGYGTVDVLVELEDTTGEVVDSETVQVTPAQSASGRFSGLSSSNYNGVNSEITYTLLSDRSNYQLTKTQESFSLRSGERFTSKTSLELISPQVGFNITSANGTYEDNVSPFNAGPVDYGKNGETFTINVTLTNNTADLGRGKNISIVRSTIEFNRTDRIEVNRSDPINTTGSILNTDVQDSTGVNVSNKEFTDDGFKFTVRSEGTANGTAANGSIAAINLNTTNDPGVGAASGVSISHTAKVTTNDSGAPAFNTVESSNITTIDQTYDKVSVTTAEFQTEQNMVNATLEVDAEAESTNNGEVENITLYNSSGYVLDRRDCDPVDSSCSGVLSVTLDKNESTYTGEALPYNKTNFTIQANGTGSANGYLIDSGDYSIGAANASIPGEGVGTKVYKEGDVTSDGPSDAPDGEVDIADIVAVQRNLGTDNGGEFPYQNPIVSRSDLDNSGSVNGTDLQDVIEEAY